MQDDIKLPPLPERFDCTNGSAQWCYGCYTMTRDDLGDYVLAEDYDALRNASEALRAERDAQQAEIERLREQLRLALRDAAPAVQGEPVAYISQEDFEFIRSDDMSEQYGTHQAPVFSRKDYRVSVPLYASPQPTAPDVSALVEALEMMLEMVELGGFGKAAAMDTARAALAAHRKQGGGR